MNVDNVLLSGGVQRFHAVPGMTKQTNAEHSWGVAVTLQHIYPECSKELLFWALVHDCPELETGDIPHPFKEKYGLIKDYLIEDEYEWYSTNGVLFQELSERDKIALRIADCLEGMKYCLSRYMTGERSALAPFKTWEAYLHSRVLIPSSIFPNASQMYDDMVKHMGGMI